MIKLDDTDLPGSTKAETFDNALFHGNHARLLIAGQAGHGTSGALRQGLGARAAEAADLWKRGAQIFEKWKNTDVDDSRRRVRAGPMQAMLTVQFRSGFSTARPTTTNKATNKRP